MYTMDGQTLMMGLLFAAGGWLFYENYAKKSNNESYGKAPSILDTDALGSIAMDMSPRKSRKQRIKRKPSKELSVDIPIDIPLDISLNAPSVPIEDPVNIPVKRESPKQNTIVLFKRDGCPHCDKFLPVFKSLKGHPDVNDIVKLKVVETSKRPDLAEKYSIDGVPQVLKFTSNNDLVDTFEGDYMDIDKLVAWMSK